MSELVVTFTREQIAGYAAASGDHNPIHLDDEFARSVGLPGVIAHGMLQMGLLARVAGDPRRLRRLSCRFAGVVRPGDRVTFRSSSPSPQESSSPLDGEGRGEPTWRVQLTALNQDGQPVLTKAVADLEVGPKRQTDL